MYIERSGSVEDRKRLTIRLSEELYKELKIHVIKKDTTINDYVLDLIIKDKSNRQSNKDKK